MSKKILISIIPLLFIACSSSPLTGWKVIDLSHSYHADMPHYPGIKDFKLNNLAKIEQGYYINEIVTAEHMGTHVDAPCHFKKGAPCVEALSLEEDLIAPLVVIDVVKEVEQNNDYALSLAKVQEWEKQYGQIPSNSYVVLNSNWWKRWNSSKAYLNKDSKGVMRFPGFSKQAVQFLYEEREVRGVGTDTLSTDIGSSSTFDQHYYFLGKSGINLENLNNLDQVPAKGAYIFVPALKIEKASGAPARIFALSP